MEKVEAIKAEMLMVSLRSIVPVVSKNEGKKMQLIEDLTWIGCEGLLTQP